MVLLLFMPFKMGILRYCGSTEFAKGQWAGVELQEPVGKNDGSVGGKTYFKCRPKHGMIISRRDFLLYRQISFMLKCGVFKLMCLETTTYLSLIIVTFD